MNIEYEDFIGVFSNVYPDGFCQHLMSEFEKHQNLGAGLDRQQSDKVEKHIKDDCQIYSNGKNILFDSFENKDASGMFFTGLQACFDHYCNQYSVLKDIKQRCVNMKIQKTSKGQGYHVWHSEQGNGHDANRGLVYMLYLNTLPTEANGETEFLYQQRRINPVENTMVLWPAGFTHPHRGNPVYGDNAKYIVTGWFYHE